MGEILKIGGRLLAMIIGIIGAILGFLFTLLHFGAKAVENGTLGTAHTPTGIAMSILALIGALIALPFPTVSAILMVIAGIVLVVVAGGFGVIPLIVLVIAAIFAFLDRNSARKAA